MPELNIEHPDYHHVPGDKRECAGREYTYGQNQFTSFWRAGPKDGTVICSKDYPHGASGPYNADGTNCSTFDKAAARAASGAKREYEKALEIVRRYEGKQ